jgi:hypothetical protein
MTTFPCLVRFLSPSGEARYRLGDPLVDRYLEFVAGRARANTLRAVTFDLETLFMVVDKDPVEVVATDVFEFLAHQRGDRQVVRISDRESGLSARTIARRLSSVAGLYAYLMARGDTAVRSNPVPRGLTSSDSATSAANHSGSAKARSARSLPTQLPKLVSPTPSSRATWLIGLPDERSRATASRLNSGENHRRRCRPIREHPSTAKSLCSGVRRTGDAQTTSRVTTVVQVPGSNWACQDRARVGCLISGPRRCGLSGPQSPPSQSASPSVQDGVRPIGGVNAQPEWCGPGVMPAPTAARREPAR